MKDKWKKKLDCRKKLRNLQQQFFNIKKMYFGASEYEF